MNITDRTTHPVLQGTGPWLRLREGFNTASEAPSALGVGKYVTRSQLLRQKHTGVVPEPDAATLGKFAAGHAAEDAARPMVEDSLGEELFPATMTAIVDGLPLLASLDGLTLAGDTVWETKLWNQELAECVRQGAHALPAHYTVQMDQELLVSGATRCLFTCTDGTPERFVSCWYEADPAKFAALIQGWKQFAADLAAYTPPAQTDPAPSGRAPDSLPALLVQVTGMVTASNLDEFKATALAAIAGVNRDLKTDQDFADAEKAVKWCSEVESRLAAAKEHALAQTASIDELFRTMDDISAEARRVRLDLDKLVKARKEAIKGEIVAEARRAYELHEDVLRAETGGPWIVLTPPDFAGAIKGLRTVDSIRNAVDTTLAQAKIRADESARKIRESLRILAEDGAGFEFLFSDRLALIGKAPEDLRLVVSSRIAAHKAAEERKEAERQAAEAKRIAEAEERARRQAEAAAVERLRQEQAAAAAEQRRQEAAEAEAQRKAQEMEQLRQKAEQRAMAAADVGVVASPGQYPAPVRVLKVEPVPMEPATLKLGTICERLGFTVTAAFLADTLHIKHSGTDKRAMLYRESDWPRICRQLAAHVAAMAELHAVEAA